MPEEIPLEERAYVIASYDINFIRSLEDIPNDTEKVYYYSLALKTPEWLSPKDVANRLASEVDPSVAEELELKRIHVFTKDLEDAMRFEYNKIEEEVRKLQSQINAKIRSECLDEEYLPF